MKIRVTETVLYVNHKIVPVMTIPSFAVLVTGNDFCILGAVYFKKMEIKDQSHSTTGRILLLISNQMTQNQALWFMNSNCQIILQDDEKIIKKNCMQNYKISENINHN